MAAIMRYDFGMVNGFVTLDTTKSRIISKPEGFQNLRLIALLKKLPPTMIVVLLGCDGLLGVGSEAGIGCRTGITEWRRKG